LPEATFNAPPEGPVSVKVVAGATGVTGAEAPEGALWPNAFLATTEQV
jgi:hypothetical protein